MPQLRQYTSQQRLPSSQIRPVVPTPDLSPVARAAMDVQGTMNELQEAQRREGERIRLDEMRVQIANTLSESQASWMERLADAKTKAPADAGGFTSTVLRDFDADAKKRTDATPDPTARRLLEDGLRRQRLALHADAFNFEIGQRHKALVGTFGEGLDADRRAVTADPTAYQDTLARRLAAAEAINLPAEMKARLLAETRRTLAADTANALVDRNPAGFLERAGMRASKGVKGKTGHREEDAVARAANDPLLSNLDPVDMRRVLDRASMLVAQQEAAAAAETERRARMAEVEARRRERAADQAWNILSERVRAGVATDPVADAKLFSAIQGTPYAAEYQRLAADIPKRQAFGMLPLPQQRAELDRVIAHRNERGTSVALDKQIEFMQQTADRAERAYADSPLRATQAYGLQNVVAVDTTTLPALVNTIGARVPQAVLAGQQVGRGASPLLPEEASVVARLFGSLPPDQQGTYIGALAQRVPPEQMQALAKQIDANNRPLSLAMAAGSGWTTEGRTTAELILRGAQAKKDKALKIDDAAESGLRAQLAKEVGDAVPAASRDAVIDAATLIYIGKSAEGNRPSAAGAVALAVGGPLIEHNGRRLPAPPGMDAAALRERLQRYPAAALAAQADDGWLYLPGGRPMGVPEFLASLPDAQLEPVGLGRYAVRSGGSLVQGKGRRPIVIEAR